MSDEQTPRSGSRWEPAPDDATVSQPAPPPVPEEATHREVPLPAAPADRPGWTQRVRNHGGLLGAGLALVLMGGIGGYAVGHAADGHDRFGLVGDQVPGAPAGGIPGADGQLPPPRHGDDGGFGTPPGSDDDGGGANESGSTL